MGRKKKPTNRNRISKKRNCYRSDIDKALDYQKRHPKKKIGDILDILKLCDPHILIDAIGEILEERAIYLQENDIKINVLDYVSLDIIKKIRLYLLILFLVG